MISDGLGMFSRLTSGNDTKLISNGFVCSVGILGIITVDCDSVGCNEAATVGLSDLSSKSSSE